MPAIQVSECIPKRGLSRLQRKVYKAIAELLDSRGYEVDDWYRDRIFADTEHVANGGDLRGAVGAVFYEGHDFAMYFSHDACYEVGCLVYHHTGKPIDESTYQPIKDMNEVLAEFGLYMEQSWCKAVIYHA